MTIYAGEKVGTIFKCIAPLTTRKKQAYSWQEEEMPRLEARNEASVVLELKDGAFQMLLTGDLEEEEGNSWWKAEHWKAVNLKSWTSWVEEFRK